MKEQQSSADIPSGGAGASTPVRKGEYWASVLVLLAVAAFFISIAALCYGIIMTPPAQPGVIPRIAFPWMGWFAAMLIAAAVILGFAQYVAGKSSLKNTSDDAKEKAWAGQLSGRALQAYRFIKDAPLFMVCSALIALGATLLVIDGAFEVLKGVILALIPYAPFFIGGITAFAIAIAALLAWFRHASNKLAAEYAFRREVLEKTGVILLDDQGKAVLPPGGDRNKYALGNIREIAGDSGPILEATPIKALPQSRGDVSNNRKNG